MRIHSPEGSFQNNLGGGIRSILYMYNIGIVFIYFRTYIAVYDVRCG